MQLALPVSFAIKARQHLPQFNFPAPVDFTVSYPVIKLYKQHAQLASMESWSEDQVKHKLVTLVQQATIAHQELKIISGIHVHLTNTVLEEPLPNKLAQITPTSRA